MLARKPLVIWGVVAAATVLWLAGAAIIYVGLQFINAM